MKNKVLQDIIDVISDPCIKHMKWSKNDDNSWSSKAMTVNGPGPMAFIYNFSFHAFKGFKFYLSDILINAKSILKNKNEIIHLNDHFKNFIYDHEDKVALEKLSKVGTVRFLAPEEYSEFIKKVDRILLAGLE